MLHQLICHPDTPASRGLSVEVDLRSATGGMMMLVYRVRSAETLRLPEHTGGPIDGLWRHTCFEMFTKAHMDPAYREFNFAPVGGWAAYGFNDLRVGMTSLDLDRPPHLVDSRLDDRRSKYPAVYELDVMLDQAVRPLGTAHVALSAVIEESDGTKSYWALRHPPGPPDFHHPDCFALELPALGAA